MSKIVKWVICGGALMFLSQCYVDGDYEMYDNSKLRKVILPGDQPSNLNSPVPNETIVLETGAPSNTTFDTGL